MFHVYTLNSIKNNYFHNYQYLIADGSSTEHNKNIFQKYTESSKNIQYKRYPYDDCIRKYVSKMHTSLQHVTAPFIMTADNDDFINPVGIDECIQSLLSDESLVFASAPIRFVYRYLRHGDPTADSFNLLAYRQNSIDLDRSSGTQAISTLMSYY